MQVYRSDSHVRNVADRLKCDRELQHKKRPLGEVEFVHGSGASVLNHLQSQRPYPYGPLSTQGRDGEPAGAHQPSGRAHRPAGSGDESRCELGNGCSEPEQRWGEHQGHHLRQVADVA